MKRKPTFSPHIGSISSGTINPDDLIPTFARELAHLLKVCRVDRETRKAHTMLLREIEIDAYPGTPEHLIEDLIECLEHYAPPYTCCGSHESDGADYGFWPSIAYDGRDDTDIPFLCAEDNPMEFTGMDVLIANKGNVECGRFDKRGRFHSYWSAV